MNRIRVVVADDHILARKAIRTILCDDPAFEVVGEAASGPEAVEAVRRLAPDLVLMDIRMPGGGIQATRAIKAEFPQVKVVVITVSDDVQDLFEAIRSGAQGYLLKNLAPEEWTAYLRGVMDGETPVSRSLAARMLREMSVSVSANENHGSESHGSLTEREREVLTHVAHGLTNREVAQALHIAENTVKNHLKNILAKLQLENRTQLARFVLQRGLLPPE